jgi:hypothetical protein
MSIVNVPDNYGLVILTCGVLPFFANVVMSGPVMKARKEFDVKYPNLYAVVRAQQNTYLVSPAFLWLDMHHVSYWTYLFACALSLE